eukprot:CAMPEP_0114495438 /NCGR_PEP_ID=MMETSP0109-20121206/5213_1 /TAXON_ID=29199 /ORGANISM="Chlorarachnion reptans, Strain CCCM449" /LENGTH=246 /DNA_ID=CAMNT_0001672597 /DNA_START=150 /DNA_END=887 /DNA_ORIENTATION=+
MISNQPLTAIATLSLLASGTTSCDARKASLFRAHHPSGFEMLTQGMDDFVLDWNSNSDYHRNVLEYFNRQYKCAHLCADRNRAIRESSIAKGHVEFIREPVNTNDVAHHTVKVQLPGVDPKDIKVDVVGDILSIEASRQWTKELLPEIDEESEKCNCEDLASTLLGKTDTLSRRLRLPSSVDKDKISVEWNKSETEMLISLPEKEPEVLSIKILEVERPKEVEAPGKRPPEVDVHNTDEQTGLSRP